jgi:recombination protein RecT
MSNQQNGNNSQQGTSLEQRNKMALERQGNLKTMLMKALPSIAGMAGRLVNPERLVRIALVASSRRPELLECSPTSILLSLLQAAQMGIEPETPLQHGYLIPRRNKNTGVTEATFEPSYRGLITVAMRDDRLQRIWARCVYSGEQFDIEYGTDDKIVHRPVFDSDARGDFIGVYAVAETKNGAKQFEAMNVQEIDLIRMRSQSGMNNNGPWKTDYEEMCKKTVIKRLIKRLPTDNEKLAAIIEHDNALDDPDAGQVGDLPLLNESVAAAAEAGSSRAEKLATELKAKRARKTAADAGDAGTAPAAPAPAPAAAPASAPAAGPKAEVKTGAPASAKGDMGPQTPPHDDREPGADDDR